MTLALSTLTYFAKHDMRPHEVTGRLPASEGVAAGTVGLSLSWLTPSMAAELRAGRGLRGIFTEITAVEPVKRGTQSARLSGVPEWFFDMIDARDRRSNGGPPMETY